MGEIPKEVKTNAIPNRSCVLSIMALYALIIARCLKELEWL